MKLLLKSKVDGGDRACIGGLLGPAAGVAKLNDIGRLSNELGVLFESLVLRGAVNVNTACLSNSSRSGGAALRSVLEEVPEVLVLLLC